MIKKLSASVLAISLVLLGPPSWVHADGEVSSNQAPPGGVEPHAISGPEAQVESYVQQATLQGMRARASAMQMTGPAAQAPVVAAAAILAAQGHAGSGQNPSEDEEDREPLYLTPPGDAKVVEGPVSVTHNIPQGEVVKLDGQQIQSFQFIYSQDGKVQIWGYDPQGNAHLVESESTIICVDNQGAGGPRDIPVTFKFSADAQGVYWFVLKEVDRPDWTRVILGRSMFQKARLKLQRASDEAAVIDVASVNREGGTTLNPAVVPSTETRGAPPNTTTTIPQETPAPVMAPAAQNPPQRQEGTTQGSQEPAASAAQTQPVGPPASVQLAMAAPLSTRDRIVRNLIVRRLIRYWNDVKMIGTALGAALGAGEQAELDAIVAQIDAYVLGVLIPNFADIALEIYNNGLPEIPPN